MEWKDQMYNNRDISAFTARHDNSYISFFLMMCREWVYKFWKDRERILADHDPDKIDKDDRLMSAPMYKDFFSLGPNTIPR